MLNLLWLWGIPEEILIIVLGMWVVAEESGLNLKYRWFLDNHWGLVKASDY